MASIEDKLKNVRTLEDIINLLTILFTNMNNQNNLYYDMFLNPEPLELTLERYDDNGELVEVKLNNRAADRVWMRTGEGSPENKVVANAGTFYLDLDNQLLWFKAGGTDSSTGWIEIRDFQNTTQESLDQYLKKDGGDASKVVNLNVNAVGLGTLNVQHGGTGTDHLEGILKGDGANFIKSAVPNTDYLAPSEFTGMIMWCPARTIVGNWLICDGSSYSTTGTYANLYARIGTKYNQANDAPNTFRVPNLIGRYVKGGTLVDVGKTGSGSVGPHKHTVVGSTSSGTPHAHGGGSLTVDGSTLSFCVSRSGQTVPSRRGAFYLTQFNAYRGDADGDGNNASWKATWDPSGIWEGSSGQESSHTHPFNTKTSENGSGDITDVDHMILVPVIRY